MSQELLDLPLSDAPTTPVATMIPTAEALVKMGAVRLMGYSCDIL